jgi:molecular chaperone DnaK
VTIKVAQGERDIFSANKQLGLFNLEGIAPAPRGMPQVEVTFDIDANGIMHVHAKDKGTGKETSIRIESGSGLSKEEIENMQKDAEAHAEEDKKLKESIETKNRADALVYSTEKSLKEHGDKVDEDTRKSIEEALESLKKAIEGGDADAIAKAEQDLAEKGQKLGEAIYKDMQQSEAAEGASGESAGDGSKDGDILDAEVVDEKDKK